MSRDIKDIIKKIDNLQELDLAQSFDIAKMVSILLREKEQEIYGREILIHVLDNWSKINNETVEMWTDLVESAGFYPYLEKNKELIKFNNTAGKIRKEYCGSVNLKNQYFHVEQKQLEEILKEKKNLIVSAPTSFGKSMLIEEVVASMIYKNIVVIQPTLALLDETRKKLKKYSNNYKIILRTSQDSSLEKGNIFLLTAERVMEYKKFPKIDFFVIDEFYKLSTKRDDERSDVLNNAFHLLANKHNSRFYLLGPNIDGISNGFAKKYDAIFYRTDYSLVGDKVIDVYAKYKEKFDKPRLYKNFKDNKLFELLLKLQNEQTIIYCSSPLRVRYLSVKFLKFLKEKTKLPIKNLSLIEWIKENVSEKWSILDCLQAGIGIHDGALQKHITSSIINYFNEGKLNYLFCTTTIIEGVNTSAKNVIFFDSTKGQRSPIDFFDYSNIKGRSGRLMVHYIGNIFNFNKIPEERKIIVDIPFFEQNPVSDEVLIQLDDVEILNKKSDQYVKLNEIPEEEKKIIKENGIFIDGQISILEKIRNDISDKSELICWDGFPKYRQLKYILGLGWDYLIKKGESTRPMTKDKIVKVTFDYAINKSILKLVESNISYFRTLKAHEDSSEQEIVDDSIRDAFQILRHWFQYKVPKWLSVINSLQKIVCEENGIEPGNYIYYSSQIENDFIEDNLSILSEYGIPRSAIEKIKNQIPSNFNEDQVIEKLKNINLQDLNLLEYEKDKLNENL